MSHVFLLSIHLPCPAEMKLLVCESLQKNPISFSPVGSWLLLIPVLQFISQAHCLHLISYSHQPLVLLETSPVDHDPWSILRGDILTLLMVLHCSTNFFSPFLFKWECLCRKPLCGSMHKSQQSLPSCMCVKHCVVEGLHGVFFFFFFYPANLVGCTVKIDHYIRVGGRNHSAPPPAQRLLASTGINQMVGT